MNNRVLSTLVGFGMLALIGCAESATAPISAARQDSKATASTAQVCKTGYAAAVDSSNAASVAADVNKNGTVCVTMDLSFNTKKSAGTPVYRFADDLL